MRKKIKLACLSLLPSLYVHAELPTQDKGIAEAMSTSLHVADNVLQKGDPAIDTFLATILPIELLKKITPLEVTLPDLVTISRFILTPFMVKAIHKEQWQKAFNIFIIAILSDKLDGSLARVLDQQSDIGNALDHFSDIFLLFAYFWALLTIKNPQTNVPVGRWFLTHGLIIESILSVVQPLHFAKYHEFLPKVPGLNARNFFVIKTAFLAWLLFSAAHKKNTRLFNTITALSIVIFNTVLLTKKISLGFKNELATMKEFLKEQLVSKQQNGNPALQ